jgi:rhamnogalacturonyl hydrolase YesR
MKKLRAIKFSVLLALVSGVLPLPAQLASPATNEVSDAQIHDVLSRVAHRRIHELKDGDYAPVKTVAEARAARPPEGIDWGPESYPQGVSLCAMLRSKDVTGDRDVEQFALEYSRICARYYHWLVSLGKTLGPSAEVSEFALNTKINGLIKLGSLDSCGAMGSAILEGMMGHPDQATPEEKEVVGRCADWVIHMQSRLPDGTLSRGAPGDNSIWPDDLYMGGVFLASWGKYTGDQKYIDDAANQIIHQAAVEQDADGLWFHGYLVDREKHAPFKWGRGNGWAMLTLVETLSVMPEDDPLHSQLLEILRKQIDGLTKVQAPDGMWRQVLDKPDLWEETSCTAMFAYGTARAVNRGWIVATNMAVARKAFGGIMKNVSADGGIKNTCEGTGMGMELDYYIKRKHSGDDPHGWGPVMLAGTEILRHTASAQSNSSTRTFLRRHTEDRSPEYTKLTGFKLEALTQEFKGRYLAEAPRLRDLLAKRFGDFEHRHLCFEVFFSAVSHGTRIPRRI